MPVPVESWVEVLSPQNFSVASQHISKSTEINGKHEIDTHPASSKSVETQRYKIEIKRIFFFTAAIMSAVG